jgi:adenine-specific DNA methylase
VEEPVKISYWRAHRFQGVIADPFMGGGTTIYESIRLGFNVVGADINPMAYWIVRQSLAPLDLSSFAQAAAAVASDVESQIKNLYLTKCEKCDNLASVKYFIWVKTEICPDCSTENDLFPGYLLAEDERHPKHVIVCRHCSALNEYDEQPTESSPEQCRECGGAVQTEGPAKRQHVRCRNCASDYTYPHKGRATPPKHRMFAMEYHCASCKPSHQGRFFKRPDGEDLSKFQSAKQLLAETPGLPLPDEAIPSGDETDRLLRWGYRFYRDMFNERQLLGLGLLFKRIQDVEESFTRHALLTVFSDFLRYQNMLCRYDTYALKCQDIFSVHGFPIGLVQCENNLLGIPRVGAGSFRHFVEKYTRAKKYAAAPFETRSNGHLKKEVVPIRGESIEAQFVTEFPSGEKHAAYLSATPADTLELPPNSLDGVFTDPPYFGNVQYAELMDFCFCWLRLALQNEFKEFRHTTTRSAEELTGNVTLGRGLEHFTEGLSSVFCKFAAALKDQAPFVFTYHHNNPDAYVPLIVAILDANMNCIRTLPAAAEMSASLHIMGTSSSILDSVFVCRVGEHGSNNESIEAELQRDIVAMREAGVKLTEGDVRCLAVGHAARITINRLFFTWASDATLPEKMARARDEMAWVTKESRLDSLSLKTLEALHCLDIGKEIALDTPVRG